MTAATEITLIAVIPQRRTWPVALLATTHRDQIRNFARFLFFLFDLVAQLDDLIDKINFLEDDSAAKLLLADIFTTVAKRH